MKINVWIYLFIYFIIIIFYYCFLPFTFQSFGDNETRHDH